MRFSKTDLDIIFKYVAERLYGDKLSSYPEAETLTGRELIPIIQGADNKNMKSSNIVDVPQLSEKFVLMNTLVTSSREEFNRGMAALNLKLEDKVAYLQQLIENLEVTGLAISQFFGDSQQLGISQDTLSKNISLLMEEILEVTGKSLGITLDINPPHVISPTTGSTTIKVTSNFGYLETIEIYADDVLIAMAHNVTELSTPLTIAVDAVVKAKGYVMGNEFIKEQTVKKLFPDFIGSGSVYTDVMNPAHAIEYNGSLVGSFDVAVSQGDRIFIVIPTYLRDTIVRTNAAGDVICSADMLRVGDTQQVDPANAFEIPFDEATVTNIEQDDLTVFTSMNTYNQGIYTIDVSNNVHGVGY